MDKRLRTILEADRLKAYKYATEGDGAAGVRFNTGLDIKQVNAVFEWRHCYGNIPPTDAMVML